jgi:adenylate cyclase
LYVHGGFSIRGGHPMNTDKFERKLSAIFSADVKGYSRLMRDDEDETIRTITAYRTAIANLVEQYRGRVVDSPGDNILSEFGSGVDAVNCAVEVQRELAERNAELPENRRMEFRIGVNLGDVVQEGERIYGDGVNIASRIEGLAEGGGICVSGTVYDSIEGKLGLEFENLGEHEVKNIDKPIRVYRVLSYPGAAAHRVVKAKKAVGRSWRRVVLAIAAVLILGGGALAIWHFYLRPSPVEVAVTSKKTPSPESPDETPPPLSDEPSIAVLPFTNISGDPKEDYLSDGITEQIITALSKTPKMLVIARNSVFTYKGKPVMVQQVSEELGVRYVLEGSVQKEGDRLRITAQLIDAKTGNHLWSERYDRELKDLFDLQDDITKNVTMAMQVKLTVGQIAHLLGKDTKNLQAYLKVVKGLSHVRRSNKDDNEIAQGLYREAIALDPDYANAYVLLAWTYYHEAFNGWAKTPVKSYKKAMELAKKAISLDEQNAIAYMVFANVYVQTGQFKKVAAAQEKALSLDPADSLINFLYGMTLYNVGKFKEAILFLKKAVRTDPKHPDMYTSFLGLSYFWTVRNAEAIAVFKKLVSSEPKNSFFHAILGASLIAAGKSEEAIAVLEKALSLNPDGPGWYVGNLSVARAFIGKSEEAITTLHGALSLDPDNAQICRFLSLVLSYEGKYEESLSMARNALSLKKKTPSSASDPEFYLTLGLSRLMMGQYVEAIAAFKKAISISTEYVYALIGLTASYSMAGRVEEARDQASEVLRINPKITLKDITKNGYLNFQKADKERFINALSKAGLK